MGYFDKELHGYIHLIYLHNAIKIDSKWVSHEPSRPHTHTHTFTHTRTQHQKYGCNIRTPKTTDTLLNSESPAGWNEGLYTRGTAGLYVVLDALKLLIYTHSLLTRQTLEL